LNALRTFEAAARLQSFSRGANELHVTHAAVSHLIKQLEGWFGNPLFHRRGRGVQLTSMGQLISSGASRTFEEISELRQQLHAPAETRLIGSEFDVLITVGPDPSPARRADKHRQDHSWQPVA
jgi:DNA-binding transcriptional LysR family regulator